MHRLLIIFFVCCLGINSWSQDSTITRKVGILPVPAFGYSPETKTYVGAVALFTIDLYSDRTRSSNAKVEFNYTWNKQSILETEWNYFFKEEKWFTNGLIHLSKYPDRYYGIGTETHEIDVQQFETNRVKTEISLLRKMKRSYMAGGELRFIDYSNTRLIGDTSPIFYPELTDRKVFGVSFITLIDRRNNLLTPTSGVYLKFEAEQNFGKSSNTRFSFDYRKYFKPFKKLQHTLSIRWLNIVSAGKPAYFDYTLFGGDKVARGYFYGRFRDQNLTTLQAEYRLKMFWRIGFAAFGGASLLFPTIPENWQMSYFKPNAGLGLRFLVDKKENTSLRFDYAIGQNGQNGFYISFGESF